MRKMLVVSAALTVALAAAPRVGAVNGPFDGNAHSNVGVMLVQDGAGDVFEFCGGVLISPTVFLTNYNCPGAVAFAQSIGGRAVITFEPIIPWPPEGSAFRTVEAGYVHPDANPKNGSDLYGIAVLAGPVRGITPAELPTLQQLASIAKTQPLTVVGYGDNSRRSATVTIQAMFPGTIQVLNNAAASGQGGVCGDGGSPYFLGIPTSWSPWPTARPGGATRSRGRSGTIRRRRGPSSTISSACRDGTLTEERAEVLAAGAATPSPLAERGGIDPVRYEGRRREPMPWTNTDQLVIGDAGGPDSVTQLPWSDQRLSSHPSREALERVPDARGPHPQVIPRRTF